jgi:trehalose 6-phosphate synthase/phosphatase
MNKLIIVSNRLPVSISGQKDNLKIKPSDGGLASAVGRVSKKLQARWIGYLGDQTDADVVNSIRKHNFFPVNIPQATYRRYYNHFSNGVLWPVLHGLRPFSSISAYWSDYVAANNAFADEVMKLADKDDAIWIHDYHLFLLPEILRARGLTNKIGFFLHTPFPERSFFSNTVPGRQILRSLMMTDSLGVQTNRHLERLRGAVFAAGAMVSQSSPVIAYRNHIVKAGAFPIGIDYRYFSRKSDRHLQFMEKLHTKPDGKILLSVSRLDYTKGIPELLKAVSELTTNPGMRGRFVLRLCVIPSRETQKEYKGLRREIEQRVTAINESIGDTYWKPVEYRYGTLAPDELLATYRQADVFVAASLADGMNLVAKEYLAANAKGVLVLGREAGAAEQLNEALLVDSSDPTDIARALTTALTESVPTKITRHLRKIVRTENVFTWAESFLSTL